MGKINLVIVFTSILGLGIQVSAQGISHSLLNIEELNSIHYSIAIGKTPVLKHQEWKSETVTIINKHGQEYICELPKVEFSENENKKDEDIFDQLVDISELLKPMEAAPCLIKRKDWWTYEFCYGSVIKQYHLEDNRVTGTLLILGKYESEYNWKNNSETKNKLQKFHSQFYVNGSRCDLTGEPRRTEVRFHCLEGAGDNIQQVDEPESCRYVVTIATTRVCHHPYLKNSFSSNPHSISCAPALNQEQFDKYQQIDDLKRKLKEEKRQLELDSGREIATEDDEDEAKWSIRLLTFPISKKAKTSENTMVIEDENDFKNPLQGNQDRIDLSKSSNLKEIDSIESPQEKHSSDVNFQPKVPEKYKKIITEVDEFAKDLSNYPDFEEQVDKLLSEYKKNENSEAYNNQIQPDNEAKIFVGQIESIHQKMQKIFDKMIEMKGDDITSKFLRITLDSLDESFLKLQEIASNLPKDVFSELFEELSNLMKTNADGLDEVLADDSENVFINMKKLSDSMLKQSVKSTDLLMKAHNHRGKSLKKLIDDHLNKDDPTEQLATKVDGDASPPSQTAFKSLPTKSVSSPDEDSIGESEESDNTDTDLIDKTKMDTSHVKNVNERVLDESPKTKLEQSIQERLQKSDNFGRKIEVKILSPNYLDDEAKDSLVSMSEEETEAFHNVIVNILSASAEEMQERERHNSLESNYNFQIDDILSQSESNLERSSSDAQPESNSEDLPPPPASAINNQ